MADAADAPADDAAARVDWRQYVVDCVGTALAAQVEPEAEPEPEAGPSPKRRRTTRWGPPLSAASVARNSRRVRRAVARAHDNVEEGLREQLACADEENAALVAEVKQARQCSSPLTAEEAGIFERLLGEAQIAEMGKKSTCRCRRHHPTVRVCSGACLGARGRC